jgi:hypothetical protein
VNLLEGNIDNIKKSQETLINASREVGIEVNTEETNSMLMSHHQKADQSRDMKIGDTLILIWSVCILLQGEGVFHLHNVNIVDFYYLFNCATCFGHTTIFMHTYFPRTYLCVPKDGRMTETCSTVK